MTAPDDDREVPMFDDTDIVVLPDDGPEREDPSWAEAEDAAADPLHEPPPHWA